VRPTRHTSQSALSAPRNELLRRVRVGRVYRPERLAWSFKQTTAIAESVRRPYSPTPTYVDPTAAEKYNHNFVVTPNGSTYRTQKTTRDNAVQTVQKESERSRNAERAPNQA
jgi:hypothetical protein